MGEIKEIFTRLQGIGLYDYSFWDLLINVAIYMAMAGVLFLIFWMYYKEKFQPRRIQNRRNNRMRIRSEIQNSIKSLFIFTAIDGIIYVAQVKGYTRIYSNVDEYGWPYLIFSIVIMILMHDAYLYFVHRFMHHPKVYNRVHKVHHQSVDPSPFAAFSFHPIEAVLEASIYVVIAFTLPVNAIALWSWQLIQITFNIIAHLGYEIYPKGLTKHWLFKFKTASTHHNMHHAKVNGNYGLYFTWWDRVFGTEFNDYTQTFEAIHERVEEAGKRSASSEAVAA